MTHDLKEEKGEKEKTKAWKWRERILSEEEPRRANGPRRGEPVYRAFVWGEVLGDETDVEFAIYYSLEIGDGEADRFVRGDSKELLEDEVG
jgi:hypothetical protein